MRPPKTVSCTPLSQSFLGLWPWGAHWDPKFLWSLRSSQPLDIGGGGIFGFIILFPNTKSPPKASYEARKPDSSWGLVW